MKKSRKRKPSSETIQGMVNRILNETEEVTINGIRERRTNLDIILLQLRASSMEGNQQATKLLLDLRRRNVVADHCGFEVRLTTKGDNKK